MINRTLRLLLAATVAAPLGALAEGDSPWLPIPGAYSVTLNQIEQSGTDAYIGDDLLPLSAITGGAASKYRRSTTNLRLGYGLSDAVSIDAVLGYGRVRVGDADQDSGVTDSIIGINWRILDEFEQPMLPTLTLRGAAILKGSYDGARLAALGNDENGFEFAAILGKQVTPSLAIWAELGAQDRSGNVPTAVFYELSARFRFAPAWSASAGYAEKNYGGDLDIGGPGFTPAKFQEVAAERGIVKLGVGFAFAANQGIALNYAQVVSGRNTVKDDQIIGVSYTFGF